MNTVIPTTKQILSRISQCRAELSQLKKLLRAAKALEKANAHRTSRDIARGESLHA